MSWNSSVSAKSSLPNGPWDTPCTHPATPRRGSTRTWCASPWAQERPSIRSPRQMGSVNGSFSLPCLVDLPRLQCPKTNQPATQPGWEVKAFCRSAAAWGPRPPAMEKTIKFQPLRSTPSPSVKTGRKSRGQERSEGRGDNLRHVHSSWMTRQPGTIWDWVGEETNSWAVGRAQEGGRMSHGHPVQSEDKQHILGANAPWGILWARSPRLAPSLKNTMGNRISCTIQKSINIGLWFHHEYFQHTL